MPRFEVTTVGNAVRSHLEVGLARSDYAGSPRTLVSPSASSTRPSRATRRSTTARSTRDLRRRHRARLQGRQRVVGAPQNRNSSDCVGAAACCTVTDYGIMYGQKYTQSQECGGDQQDRHGAGVIVFPVVLIYTAVVY